jgi:hypothetical protein
MVRTPSTVPLPTGSVPDMRKMTIASAMTASTIHSHVRATTANQC